MPLSDRDGFAAWLAGAARDGVAGRAQEPRDRVPHRILWWVHDGQYLGRVRINLHLNAGLEDFGGHIGYAVRPGARGRGHATAILSAALDLAHRWGIDQALLTCAPENLASRRVIERNGGVLRDTSPSGRLRYWAVIAPADRHGRSPGPHFA